MPSFTFALIKPDAVANPIALKWISDALFHHRLQVVKGCRLKLTREQAIDLYSVHREKFFFSRLIRHVCSGVSILMRLEPINQSSEGSTLLANFLRYAKFFEPVSTRKAQINKEDDALQRWRAILGPSKLFGNFYTKNESINEWDYLNIRQYFAVSDTRNVGHGSDSLLALKREYAIFESLMHEITHVDIELFQLNQFVLPLEDNNDIM